MQEQLFKAEEKLLDLRYQKETFDLQFARLQKRITDLEQYKLASAQFSAVRRHKEDEVLREIEDHAQAIAGPTTKAEGDTVKLRSRGSKTVGELEMLVESLKRVIEKQKAENEALRKQAAAAEGQQEKLKSEKQMRQKIEHLETEVHHYEMKDLNLAERDKTSKKLLEANRQLRDDLRKEVERYQALEGKYKDLLVKYNVLAKENAKNAELLFAVNTGSNLHNYAAMLNDNTFERSF